MEKVLSLQKYFFCFYNTKHEKIKKNAAFPEFPNNGNVVSITFVVDNIYRGER